MLRAQRLRKRPGIGLTIDHGRHAVSDPGVGHFAES